MSDSEIRVIENLIEKESEIRSSWDIALLFEEQKEEIRREKLALEAEREDIERRLQELTTHIIDSKEQLNDLELKRELLSNEIDELQKRKNELTIYISKQQTDELTRSRSSVISEETKEESSDIDAQGLPLEVGFPEYLKKLQVKLKNGTQTVAKPLTKVYSYKDVKEIFDEVSKSKVLVQKVDDLREKVLDLELENAKLRVENRDLKLEYEGALQERE